MVVGDGEIELTRVEVFLPIAMFHADFITLYLAQLAVFVIEEMLTIGIACIERTFEGHIVVVVIRNPLTHLLVVAILALGAHVADLLGPFAVFHAIEIGT